MGKSKYGNLLTVVLIVVIVAILGLAGFGIISLIKGNDDNIIEAKVYEEFEENGREYNKRKKTNSTNLDDYDPDDIDENDNQPDDKSVVKKTYYNGFIVAGYISIPKIGIDRMAIIDKETPAALETSVAVRYQNNGGINEEGNVVIAGHNYRNGKFFSDLKRVSIGDKIIIKDVTLNEITYTVYSVFETTPEDTSFYNRDTEGAKEITLSTCTDDSSARTIVCARAEE